MENKILKIELKEVTSYNSQKSFITAVTEYAKYQGFQIRLGKVKKNATENICKRTIFCNREGSPAQTSNNIRNRSSQHCNCQFIVRASLNTENGLWYIILIHLEYNHPIVSTNF